eukprot:scaffold17023_cov32-Tisochrysis_lutea.AAC.5
MGSTDSSLPDLAAPYAGGEPPKEELEQAGRGARAITGADAEVGSILRSFNGDWSRSALCKEK